MIELLDIVILKDEDGNTIEASLCTEYTPEQLQKVETTLTLT